MRPLYSLLLPLVIPDEAFPSSGGIVHKYEFLVPLFHGLHCSGCIYEITGFCTAYGFSLPVSEWISDFIIGDGSNCFAVGTVGVENDLC